VSIVALDLLQPLSHIRQAKNALSRVFREPIARADDRPEVRPNKVPDRKDKKKPSRLTSHRSGHLDEGDSPVPQFPPLQLPTDGQ
jgi:hypothetical protein